jgi:hypothetical protein
MDRVASWCQLTEGYAKTVATALRALLSQSPARLACSVTKLAYPLPWATAVLATIAAAARHQARQLTSPLRREQPAQLVTIVQLAARALCHARQGPTTP